MTYEDWIIAVAAEAPRRSGSALKLLLHLVSVSIQSGSTQVRLSDRDLEKQIDISRQSLTDAKKSLADLVGIDARPGVPSVFNLPADWFPGQRSLFPQPVANFLGHQRPGNLATTGQETRPSLANKTGQSGQESRPGGQENGPPVANKLGQVAYKTGQSGQESRPPATENQQDAGALSNSISISGVSSTQREYVISILSKRALPVHQRPEATILAAELQGVLHQLGAVQAAEKLPDDVLLAQLLAIASLRELLPALKVAKARRGRPKGYAWFVTAMLENISGIPREATKQIVEELRNMRQAKPPGRAELLPFPAEIAQMAANQVKTLR